MADIDRSRVLEAVPERANDGCDSLWKSLTFQQLGSAKSVAAYMWQSYMNSTRMSVPQARIFHDKFHISKYLGEAVDKVRRSERLELKQVGESSLTRLRQLLLYNEENLEQDDYFEVLTI